MNEKAILHTRHLHKKMKKITSRLEPATLLLKSRCSTGAKRNTLLDFLKIWIIMLHTEKKIDLKKNQVKLYRNVRYNAKYIVYYCNVLLNIAIGIIHHIKSMDCNL